MNLHTIAACGTVLALGLAACSGGSAPIGPDPSGGGRESAGDGTARAGSRLHLATYTNNDGSQASAGWFDTKLGKQCAFERIADAKSACVPLDVYTIPGENFGALKTANPTFFLDSSCSGKKGIIVPDSSCIDYGIARIDPEPGATRRASCGPTSFPQYVVLTPVDRAKQKIYTYGVPDGGGRCCSCNELSAGSLEDAKLFLYEPATAENLARVDLVIGEVTF